jgi:hypothetical protein
MIAKLRILAALCALVAAVIMVGQSQAGQPLQVQASDIPMTNVTTSIKYPVIDITDPDPFNPCRDLPLDVMGSLGLTFTPPIPEEGMRCKYDAGNYQMAVEAFVWKTYEEALPADAIQLDIDGHRAAQWWVMKPTDWNNRWWMTCAIGFDTDYGLIQQTIFFSTIYSNPPPDCMQTNLQRAHELVPHYIFQGPSNE